MTIRYCETGCGNVALVDTKLCLQHVDLGAPVPIPPLLPLQEVDQLLVRLGEQLDAEDFAAAHDSVRPELAAALQAAAADKDPTGAVVMSLNDLAATDPAAFYRCLDAEIAKAAASIPPGYDIAVSCDSVGNVFDSNRVAFKITGTPRAEPPTLDDIVEMMKTPGKFIEFAAPRMGITQPITDLHQAVIIAEATAVPVTNRRTTVEKRRSIGVRLWHTLTRWSR